MACSAVSLAVTAWAAVERSVFTLDRFSTAKIAAKPRSKTEPLINVFGVGGKVPGKESTDQFFNWKMGEKAILEFIILMPRNACATRLPVYNKERGTTAS